MNERLKKLRKELDMTQQEFADRIGIKRNSLANYETGRNTPIDAIIVSICREFNVNENWLRTGEGEMFVEMSYDDEIAQFVGQVMGEEDDSFKKRLISGLAALDDNGWKVLEDFLDSIQTKKD
ncbi:helix-turn-helix domain-containing protein [Coprococcus comes]|jgi:transcriptional regulator with XRE-family HTH domain|uniref:helix-turn-helix domain-containing protein n=1 Tax=Coprococcus comes TaxID=410072 RepID=UPI00156FD326|nr:helix-turn-helix transcriptional regulator [Coprococcus comes]NSD32085.1 helix-turn-helix transcriptional regulator [Coprococcus comes]